MTKQRVLTVVTVIVVAIAVGAIIYFTSTGQDKQDPVAATVNGRKILMSTYKTQVDEAAQNLKVAYPENEYKTRLFETKKATLSRLIDVEIARQLADDAGIQISDSDLQAALGKYIEASGGKAALAKQLAAQGSSMSAYEMQIEQQELLSKYRDKVAGNVTVTDNEILQAYNASQNQFRDASGAPRPLSQVKNQVRSMLIDQKKNELMNKKVDEFKKNAKIEIFVPELKNAGITQ